MVGSNENPDKLRTTPMAKIETSPKDEVSNFAMVFLGN